MRTIVKIIAVVALLCSAAQPGYAADDTKEHHIAIQVDQDDPAVMNLALNNVVNVLDMYQSKGQSVKIEVVAYGPGLRMLRDDTSPVKDRIKQLAALSFPSEVKFSACNITKTGMEKHEGHPVTIVPQAGLVPSGAMRLVELQEDGWSYLKP
jgi:intracellular sulfur oxidation DsrE/DsrF family protein